MVEVDWLLVSGVLVRGHKVASRPSAHYPRGTLEMQAPFFRERGLDLSPYFSGTLNISIAPHTFKVLQPELHFSRVHWTSNHPAEDFSFSRCRVLVGDVKCDGWVYYPHPETKARHHQNQSVIEVLAPSIEDLGYGDRIDLELRSAEIDIERYLDPTKASRYE